MASPASKKMAKIWRRSLGSLPSPLPFAQAVRLSKSSSALVSGRDAAGVTPTRPGGPGCNAHPSLEDLEHQKKVGALSKIIDEPVRAVAHNARLQPTVDAGILTSSGLLNLDDAHSLNCCMWVWVNMVQLLVSSVVQLLTMSKPTLDN